MGDSWISPIDSVLTWGPYLYSTVSNSYSNLDLLSCLTAVRIVLVAYVSVLICFTVFTFFVNRIRHKRVLCEEKFSFTE